VRRAARAEPVRGPGVAVGNPASRGATGTAGRDHGRSVRMAVSPQALERCHARAARLGADARSMRHSYPALLAGLVLALLLAGLLALGSGSFPLSLGDVLRLLAARLGAPPPDLPATAETVLWQIRGPRVLAALAVGAVLAASGTALQSVFRNPLAAPDLLGVSAGSAVGAVLGIFLGWAIWAIQAAAFV